MCKCFPRSAELFYSRAVKPCSLCSNRIALVPIIWQISGANLIKRSGPWFTGVCGRAEQMEVCRTQMWNFTCNIIWSRGKAEGKQKEWAAGLQHSLSQKLVRKEEQFALVLRFWRQKCKISYLWGFVLSNIAQTAPGCVQHLGVWSVIKPFARGLQTPCHALWQGTSDHRQPSFLFFCKKINGSKCTGKEHGMAASLLTIRVQVILRAQLLTPSPVLLRQLQITKKILSLKNFIGLAIKKHCTKHCANISAVWDFCINIKTNHLK